MQSSSINAQIQQRIHRYEPAHVFSASDFTDLADSNTVRQTLSRLEKQADIQRIMRGFYYRPAYSELLKEYEAPSPNEVALALARRHHWTITPSGNTALNLLGLSTQVSAKWSYISDGPYREFAFGNVILEFRHRANKEISGLSPKTALVIQSIRALSKDQITPEIISKIASSLTAKEKTALLEESMQVATWIRQTIQQICQEMD